MVVFVARRVELGDDDENEEASDSTAAQVANDARDWRIALQAARPPPDEIAVEGRTLIETLADLETAARNVATCIGLDACTAAVSRFNTAIASVTGALSAVNPKL